MMRAVVAHFREALGLAGRAAPETFLVPAFLALLAASLIAGGERAVGLAAAAAACGAFSVPDRLLADLRGRGSLAEALGAPVSGALLSLVWLGLAACGGLLGGLGVLLLAAPQVALGPALFPLSILVVLFGALGLLASLLLPEAWILPVQIYLVPFFALWGAMGPIGAQGFHPELFNPVHLAVLAMQGLGAGALPLIGTGALVALASGVAAFAVDSCRRGIGLRTR